MKSRAEELVQSLSDPEGARSLERLRRSHAPRRADALSALRTALPAEVLAAREDFRR